MGNFWSVQQSNGNLTSSGTGIFRGDIQTLEGQFLGDGGALDNVVYSVNSESGALSVVGLGNITVFTSTGQVAISGTTTDGEIVTVSGYLQGQIDQNTSSINDNTTLITTTSGHLQAQITNNSDHGNLTGLADDDHTQYILVDGTRAFTGTASGTDFNFSGAVSAQTGDFSTGLSVSGVPVDIGGGSGGLSNIVEDTTPQLGGNLDVNGFYIGNAAGTSRVTFPIVGTSTISGSAALEVKAGVSSDLVLAAGVSTFGDVLMSAGGTVSITAPDTNITGTISGTEDFNLAGAVNAQAGHFSTELSVSGIPVNISNDHGNLLGLADDDHTQYILEDGSRPFSGTVQATSSGTQNVGTASVPFGEVHGVPVVREFVTVSGAPQRGMIAIDSNNQFVGYNGTDWIILG